MDLISQWAINHVLHQPAVLAVSAALLANVDRIIAALLKVFSPAQLDAAIDKADAAAKAEVAKVAGQSKSA